MKRSTLARPSSSRKIGTTITWTGATLGGTISPESSPCAITSAPTSRVLMPHDVEWHSSRAFSLFENEMS